MKMYSLKVEPVEAMQWTGENFADFDRWLGDVAVVDIIGRTEQSILILSDPMNKDDDVIMVHVSQFVVRFQSGEVQKMSRRSFERCYVPALQD